MWDCDASGGSRPPGLDRSAKAAPPTRVRGGGECGWTRVLGLDTVCGEDGSEGPNAGPV